MEAEPAIPQNVRRALAVLKEKLSARFGGTLVELRLYGSYARGEQHEESDVDVLVLLRAEPTRHEVDELFRDVAQVDIEEGLFIAPLVCSEERFCRMRDQELQIALDIEEQGIRV